MDVNEARILRGVAGVYLISNPDICFQGTAVARGLFRKDNIKPLPGDIVRYESSNDPDIPWVITSINPRKNQINRPPMSNLDLLLLTASAEYPKADYHYLDRMICYASNNQIDVVLILTKCDLPETEKNIEEFKAYFNPTNFDIYFISLDHEDNFPALKERIRGLHSAFAGQSGVGKSTLMNRLLGEDVLETGNLSEKVGRGKQTTRSVEIYQVANTLLSDTPGFQSIEITKMNLEPRNLVNGYPEILAISNNCRYSDCRHLNEPGCAIEQSTIHPKRLETYRSLRKELENYRKY